MKALIIGGTGVISRSITRHLVERGDDVTHFNRGVTEGENLNVKVIRGDRKDLPSFEQAMKVAGNFDCIIDMLCFSPEEAKHSVAMFKGRTGQYIFCSSVDVYSKTGQKYPILETAEKEPSNEFQYAVNKAKCEEILFAAHGDQFPVTIFRPAQTYGEGGTLVHTLGFDAYYFYRLRQGLPIIVHGDGNSLWVTCHSDDVGRAFAAAVGNQVSFGKAYNVTGEDWMTWNRYNQDVASAIGAPTPDIVHIPSDTLQMIAPERSLWCHINFQYNNIFDNSLAKSELQFKQTIEWKDGVRRTVKWLDDHDSIKDNGEQYYDDILNKWNTMVGRQIRV